MKWIWIIGLGFFCGCTLEPKYETPTFSLSNNWKTQWDAGPLQYKNWWDAFEDSLLTEFIEKAIQNNQDLLAAGARVDQARDLAKIARAKLIPWFNANLSYQNQEVQTQLYGPDLPSHPYASREHQREYALPMTMTYEVDVWGKIRSAYKSADLYTDARQDAYNAVMLIATTELANAYFQARILDSVQETYGLLVKMRQKILEIYSSRYDGQIIDYSETAQAEAECDRIKAMYDETKQKRAVYENMIAVLMGEDPSEFELRPMPLSSMPPMIPEGVPADILGRRPDLLELQRLMQSVHALLGVSYAEYFPALDLNGGFGSIAPLSKYFLKGLSLFWSMGGSFTEILFNGLAREYKIQLNWDQFSESVARFRQGILNACQEVENALSNLEWLKKRMENISGAIDASKTDRNISSNRFELGVDSYLPVAVKEARVLEDDLRYLSLLGLRYSNTVQLIRALGGGW